MPAQWAVRGTVFMSATRPAHPAPALRSLEVAGLLLALAAFAYFLAHAYQLKAYSDPVQWYAFGRNFSDKFGSSYLAYGFPLLVALAIELVGPFWAFLVNIPVLIALAALVYAFARRLLASPAE